MLYLSEVQGFGGISARVVKASKHGHKSLWTIETKAPKFIDAEFEKHRMLSSNSSSSRAIPFKLPKEIYIPIDIRRKQSGMQGYDNLSEEETIIFGNTAKAALGDVYHNFLYHYEDEVHKQHLNRYMEPWMYQKKVVTATEWDNFFRLRLSADAQPEIQELARCMKKAMDSVEPDEIYSGEWHLPYVTEIYDMDGLGGSLTLDQAKKCSVARCARVSYFNTDNSSPSIDKDLELYDRLLSSGHMTPFEHQATPMTMVYGQYIDMLRQPGATHIDRMGRIWSANFHGWIQHRKLVEGAVNGFE